MYAQFYGLKTLPFSITSDPQVFFESSSYKEALSLLLYGISSKSGLMLLTGEVGAGKTTLCKTLISRLEPCIKTSLILNPYFSEVQLLAAIVEDFGIYVGKKSRLDIIKTLNNFLVDISSKGGNAVLVIDEAQNLTARQLEQVRLLSNLETSQEKLLQIILVGQPELRDKLDQFNLRQIRQRISVKYSIPALTKDEVRNYIEFRLKIAGTNDVKILPEGYNLIYEFSRGIPRLINILCDRALVCGFVRDKRIFDADIFKACIEELK